MKTLRLISTIHCLSPNDVRELEKEWKSRGYITAIIAIGYSTFNLEIWKI